MRLFVLLFSSLGLASLGFAALAEPSVASEETPVPRVLLLGGDLHHRVLAGKELSAADRSEVLRLPLLLKRQFGPGVTAPQLGPVRFVSPSGALVRSGAPVPAGGVRLLPVAPGLTGLRLTGGMFELAVVEIRLVSHQGQSLVPRRRLSISRAMPRELALSSASAEPDAEAVSIQFIGPDAALPSTVDVTSFSANRRYLDALGQLPLASAPCSEVGLSCATTQDLRVVVDAVERNHPKVKGRSLIGEVGGRVDIRTSEEAHRDYPIGGPSSLMDGEVDPGRYRMRIRARLVNMQKGGPPPVGQTEDEALSIVADELGVASQIWGQCGIVLGAREDWDIAVVDPPEIALIEVGCRGGVRATGGTVSLELEDQKGRKRRIEVRTGFEETPESVATVLQHAIEHAGYQVERYRNAQIAKAALPSFDLLVQDRQGRSVQVRPTNRVPTDDPTLGVCLGELDLGDGLEHFTDFNAAAGTLEERMLLRGLSDDDPTTIELIVVPIFSGMGRIGESFIKSPRGSLNNALILDRGGIRAGARSLTLAHELGHILLEMPGHPDDFGVDTPTSLMDADAADATIFGPRRLSLDDCRRALRQSGPRAPVALLTSWPID